MRSVYRRRSAGLARPSHRASSKGAADWSKAAPAVFIVCFLLGYIFRPSTVTSDRSGAFIALGISACNTISDCIHTGLPVGVFGLVKVLVPFAPSSLGGWDISLAVVGGIVMIYLSLWVSRARGVDPVRILTFGAMSALASMYIFMLSKDVVQVFFFLAAFGVIYAFRNAWVSVVAVACLFAAEGAYWRPYYFIVAFALPCVFYLLGRMRGADWTPRQTAKFIAIVAAMMLVFAFVLKFVSPTDYAKIVDQHGAGRESFTATNAASGIKSLIDVNSSSPVPLFVLNWVVNTFRLLFPVELLLKSPYYWVFCLYQIAITVYAFRAIRTGTGDRRLTACAALWLAFVIASGVFEPDFGSWVRHETASLPILVSLVLGRVSPRATDSPDAR